MTNHDICRSLGEHKITETELDTCPPPNLSVYLLFRCFETSLMEGKRDSFERIRYLVSKLFNNNCIVWK